MNVNILKKFMDEMCVNRTPGCAVKVYKDGNIVFDYASGYSDIESKKIMTGNEYFNLYSCSKVATVTAALQLVEKGIVLPTDPLYEYIPEFKDMYVKDENGIRKAANPITILNLFTMTAGFSYNYNTEGFQKARALTKGKMDTADVIRCMAEDPLLFEPGEKFNYSLCHDVLAVLVEVVSGKRFKDYMKEQVFEPLEMNSTFYHHNEQIKKNLATQYTYVPFEELEKMDAVELQKSGVNYSNNGYFKHVGPDVYLVFGEEYDSGGAGITSTGDDYIKLMAALANKGIGMNGNRILTPGAVELMYTNALTEKQRESFNWKQLSGYGYGYGVRTLIDKARAGSIGNYGEFGWGGAAGATVLADTKENLAMVFLQHTLNPREDYYQPRLRNALYCSVMS